MTSRTGRACEARGGACPRVAGAPAFTLIEVLVVMMLIGILAGVILPVLGKARAKAKREWTRKELSELGAALLMYHDDHIGYPPDTDDWGSGGKGGNSDDQVDEWSIHRYLGLTVVTKKGESYDAYLGIRFQRLSDIGGDGAGDRAGKYLDPYEQPYQLDAMHMIPPDIGAGTGWLQSGWPYGLVTKDAPTPSELQEMVRDFKVVCYGPDTVSADFPFDPDPTDGRAKDDIRSW